MPMPLLALIIVSASQEGMRRRLRRNPVQETNLHKHRPGVQGQVAETMIKAPLQLQLQLQSTTRHWAKKPRSLEVASEACTQAFGTHTFQTRLQDKPPAALRFSTGF